MVFQWWVHIILCTISIGISAVIPNNDFNALIQFIQTTNLTTASPEIYDLFIKKTQQIARDGSPEQQALLASILENGSAENQAAPKNTHKMLEEMQEIVEADVISPAVWNQFIEDIRSIENSGTSEEKNTVTALLHQNQSHIVDHMKALIQSAWQSPELKKTLLFIAINTIMGALPTVGFKALSILSGNLDVARATTSLIDVGVLSAMDNMVRYTLQEQPTLITAPLAAAISTVIQEFIGYAGPRSTNTSLWGPLLGQPMMNSLQVTGILLIKQEIQRSGNIEKIIQNLSWKDLAFGQARDTAIANTYPTLSTYLQNSLQIIVKNSTVRTAVATTLSYAIEGALIAATLNALGVGFYTENMQTALVMGAFRGALEGLYYHTLNKERTVGIVQRLHGGFAALSIQRYLAAGVPQSNLYALTPLITQQLITGAIDGIIHKAGGWHTFIGSLFKR
jgi:hypothetical protein